MGICVFRCQLFFSGRFFFFFETCIGNERFLVFREGGANPYGHPNGSLSFLMTKTMLTNTSPHSRNRRISITWRIMESMNETIANYRSFAVSYTTLRAIDATISQLSSLRSIICAKFSAVRAAPAWTHTGSIRAF